MTHVIIKPPDAGGLETVGIVMVVRQALIQVDEITGEVTRVTETSEEACIRFLPQCPPGSFIEETVNLPASRALRNAWRKNEAGDRVVEDAGAAAEIARELGAVVTGNDGLEELRAKVEEIRRGGR